MRKATRIVASALGILAGIAGLEHGYFESLQGNVHPAGLMFPSWGPAQCDPAKIWHACEPAMSLIPNLLISGGLTMALGVVILLWSVFFVQRDNGGRALLLLSIALLLVGGGFFPPLIGLVGGVAGTRIRKPFSTKPSGLARFSARLWPWPPALLVGWLAAQFPVGYFFNDALKSVMGFALLFIVAFLPLSVYVGYARDAVQSERIAGLPVDLSKRVI